MPRMGCCRGSGSLPASCALPLLHLLESGLMVLPTLANHDLAAPWAASLLARNPTLVGNLRPARQADTVAAGSQPLMKLLWRHGAYPPPAVSPGLDCNGAWVPSASADVDRACFAASGEHAAPSRGCFVPPAARTPGLERVQSFAPDDTEEGTCRRHLAAS